MKHTWIYTLSLLLAVAGCSKTNVNQQPPPVPVMAVKAEPKTIPYYIDTLGHFAAYNTVTIQAQVQGELTGLYFKEGHEVQAGDLLFTIDKRPYVAVYDKAVATLRQNQATLAYNKSRQERYSGLVEEDFVSKLQYEQYVTELESQEAVIAENKAEIDSAAINVGYCTIYSPITGIVGKRLIDVGNIITDVGTKMLVINQVSPLFIDFSIPERHFDDVYMMQQEQDLLIEIYVPNTSLKAYAKLQMLDNTINAQTGQIALRGILPNENKYFWPEQFVRIRLIVDQIPNAIMVPPEAIESTNNGEIVWVINADQTVSIAPVEVGEEYESEVRIKKGLKPGQMVVTKGQLSLAEGRQVVIKTTEKDLKQ